jgi:ankyrin repeat protein
MEVDAEVFDCLFCLQTVCGQAAVASDGVLSDRACLCSWTALNPVSPTNKTQLNDSAIAPRNVADLLCQRFDGGVKADIIDWDRLLLAAVSEFDVEMVQRALASGASKTYGNNAAFRLAVNNRNMVFFNLLFDDELARDADAFAAAASLGDAEMCERFLLAGADINAKDSAPLRAAVQANKLDTVTLLLTKCKTPAREFSLWSMVRIAAANDFYEILKFLLKKVPRDDKSKFASPMHHAVANGRVKVVRLLLKKGAEVSAMNYKSLETASMSGNVEMVKTLFAHVRRAKDVPFSILVGAVMHGTLDVVKFLVKKGMRADTDNSVLLVIAEKNKTFAIYDYLVKNGADPQTCAGHHRRFEGRRMLV